MYRFDKSWNPKEKISLSYQNARVGKSCCLSWKPELFGNWILMYHLSTIYVKSKGLITTIKFMRTVSIAFYEQTYVLNTFIMNRLHILLIITAWKCPHSEFSWSVFARIWTEYGKIWRITPYSIWMRENTGQKNSEYGHFSRSDY